MIVSMEKIGEYFISQRLRRQLVYPFLEIDYQTLDNGFERKLGGDDMVDVVERAKDGRLLSIKEVSDI